MFPRLRALRRLIGAALDIALKTETIREVLVQAGLYAGFSASEETLALAAEVFAARGIPFPARTASRRVARIAHRARRQLMGELHGDRAQSGYAAPDNPVTGALYPMAIQYGYGEIWFRPGLDRRARALVAVAAFTALRLPEQVAKFGQSALNAGLTRTEVIEAVIQTAPHSGFPPALNAWPRWGRCWCRILTVRTCGQPLRATRSNLPREIARSLAGDCFALLATTPGRWARTVSVRTPG